MRDIDFYLAVSNYPVSIILFNEQSNVDVVRQSVIIFLPPHTNISGQLRNIRVIQGEQSELTDNIVNILIKFTQQDHSTIFTIYPQEYEKHDSNFDV